ncbi:MAG TPA: TfoX/Sxy family protein [Rhizomicrobium sp.]|nr:TfoX/Sxy family protein [Rhizomicrobium sp.]
MPGDPGRFDDLFQNFGRIAIKRMFGGEGIFAGPVMIGLVMDAQIYLRTDEASRLGYLAEKSRPFTFRKGGKTITTAYYSLPDRLLDEPEELAAWAKTAHRIALAKSAGKIKPR